MCILTSDTLSYKIRYGDLSPGLVYIPRLFSLSIRDAIPVLSSDVFL